MSVFNEITRWCLFLFEEINAFLTDRGFAIEKGVVRVSCICYALTAFVKSYRNCEFGAIFDKKSRQPKFVCCNNIFGDKN